MTTPPDPWTLRREAGAHRKATRHAEALVPFTALWGLPARDAWDGWGLAFCLDKLGRTAEALDVCRDAYRLDADHDAVRQLYAGCVYRLHVRDADADLGGRLRAAQAVCRLVGQDNRYGPFVNTVLTMARAFAQAGRHADALGWLDRLDLADLSAEPFRVERNGRASWAPSDAQRAWGIRAKALHALGQHAACRDAAEAGLRAVPRFVNDGDVWLWRLSALSLAAEGNADEAYRTLSALVARTPTWFLEHDLAGLAHGLGRTDDAWRHLLRALDDRAPAPLRVGVFARAAAWHEAAGDVEAAAAHAALVCALREREGWPLKPAHREQAARLGVDLGRLPDVRRALDWLTPAWRAHLDRLTPRLSGVVERILADGQAAFVRSDCGASHYARARELRGGGLEAGLRVSFRTAPGYDRKRDRPTLDAVDLRLADDGPREGAYAHPAFL